MGKTLLKIVRIINIHRIRVSFEAINPIDVDSQINN